MILISKLEAFRKQPEKMKQYNEAVIALKELGVDQILLELSLPQDLPMGNPNAGNIAMQQLGEAMGYQKCLHDLFSLDEIVIAEKKGLIADFGANAKMGITNKEARELGGL
jgi:hypothetical protein